MAGNDLAGCLSAGKDVVKIYILAGNRNTGSAGADAARARRESAGPKDAKKPPENRDNRSESAERGRDRDMSNVESHLAQELDVREIPPARRHALIFHTYEALEPGRAFVLVNDHDPKPLYYQFEAERRGEFTWDYLEQGPEVWRVRIGRRAVENRNHA
jgi:uncharacterized protein (DUF2249 family)